MGVPSLRSVVGQYGRAVKASVVHGSDPRLQSMWRPAVISAIFTVCAVLALADGATSSSRRMSSILAALFCIALAIANGTYVVLVVRRNGFLESDPPPPPDPDDY